MIAEFEVLGRSRRGAKRDNGRLPTLDPFQRFKLSRGPDARGKSSSDAEVVMPHNPTGFLHIVTAIDDLRSFQQTLLTAAIDPESLRTLTVQATETTERYAAPHSALVADDDVDDVDDDFDDDDGGNDDESRDEHHIEDTTRRANERAKTRNSRGPRGCLRHSASDAVPSLRRAELTAKLGLAPEAPTAFFSRFGGQELLAVLVAVLTEAQRGSIEGSIYVLVENVSPLIDVSEIANLIVEAVLKHRWSIHIGVASAGAKHEGKELTAIAQLRAKVSSSRLRFWQLKDPTTAMP